MAHPASSPNKPTNKMPARYCGSPHIGKLIVDVPMPSPQTIPSPSSQLRRQHLLQSKPAARSSPHCHRDSASSRQNEQHDDLIGLQIQVDAAVRHANRSISRMYRQGTGTSAEHKHEGGSFLAAMNRMDHTRQSVMRSPAGRSGSGNGGRREAVPVLGMGIITHRRYTQSRRRSAPSLEEQLLGAMKDQSQLLETLHRIDNGKRRVSHPVYKHAGSHAHRY